MIFHSKTCICSHQNNANRGGALVSDDESDEGEEGDYTVYECPGLATVLILFTGLNKSFVKNYKNERYRFLVWITHFLLQTGEMEVRNPLFSEDQTPKASSMPPNQSSQ